MSLPKRPRDPNQFAKSMLSSPLLAASFIVWIVTAMPNP
jgi:hypothetical protein